MDYLRFNLNQNTLYSSMFIQEHISNQQGSFLEICSKHKVKSLYAFGSSIQHSFNKESSDIDLLIELSESDPLERGELLISIWDEFETFFNRRIDLLTQDSAKNPYLKKSIDQTKVLIYDGSSQEIVIC
uniref:nucleotidyltransferase family protein n=1 Tax=Roseivirga sp. TaxID=1964215 RepID=UPI004047F5AC